MLDNGDVVVHDGRDAPDGWIERLRAAAYSDTIAATASPVTGDAPALLERAPVARLTAPEPGCFYARRSALELCGPLDDGFARRCLEAGLQHVLAGDVIVPGRVADAPDPLSAEARVRRVARLARGRPSVTVDALCLSPPMTGTQTHVLELTLALVRSGAADVRVVLPPDPDPLAAQALRDVEQLSRRELEHAVRPTDVVHRPYQVTSQEDLDILRRLGERVVITHQDLIGYRNPAYHADAGAWEVHRRLTRESFGLADAVVFESAHARADALADDLLDERRARLIGIGTDHALVGSADPARPAEAPDGAFLLVLGSDFRHKNRVWAMRLLEALGARGWDGSLVLAGPQVAHGGSRADEDAWLAAHPAARVHRLGAVSEAEKAWLYREAAAVLYPTTYEGFGLIPFEAAAYGTACLWAPIASLAD